MFFSKPSEIVAARKAGEFTIRSTAVASGIVVSRSKTIEAAFAWLFSQDNPVDEPLYWFWGDTERVSYPLGNFSASGATSELPGRGGLDPNVGVDLTYHYSDTS